MKKSYAALFVVLLFAQQNASAQVWLGVYGLRTNSYSAKTQDVGGGFGVNFLSEGKAINGKNSPLRFQAGVDFNYSGLGFRTFRGVPLSAPQTGTAQARLQNGVFTTNILLQLSLSTKSIFRPYGNIFLGYRGSFSSLSLTPDVRMPGYESQTDQNIASAHGLNFGLGLGLLTRIKNNIYFDAGVIYNEMVGAGRMTDLNTVYAHNNGLNMHFKSAPNALLMVKVGLVFFIERGEDSDDDDDCNCRCKHRNRSGTWIGGGWGWSGGGGAPSRVNINLGGIAK